MAGSWVHLRPRSHDPPFPFGGHSQRMKAAVQKEVGHFDSSDSASAVVAVAEAAC